MKDKLKPCVLCGKDADPIVTMTTSDGSTTKGVCLACLRKASKKLVDPIADEIAKSFTDGH